ncbi:MAG: L-threonylcarbamoyladenylate synthase [Nitrospiraceae bacterium]|nr:L-threonylcarbamoyladenylate synthase [Nitrospiraceae bacterium]
MIVLRTDHSGRQAAVTKARDMITAGGVIAFPTETFYGIGVRYDDADALQRLYALKRRSADKALPLIIGSRDLLPLVSCAADPLALLLAERFWPGPLTILMGARRDLPDLITAGTGKVAVRIPGPSFALDLVRSLPFPITATSANISGSPPASDPEDVLRYFDGMLDMLIDAGTAPGGRPSTIIEVIEGKIALLREGAVSYESIVKIAERPPADQAMRNKGGLV